MRSFLERIKRSSQSSFALMRYTPERFIFGWHHHPELELTLIMRGRGRRFVGDAMSAFEAGDLVLLGGNLPHTWSSDQFSTGRQDAVVLQFRDAWLKSVMRQVPELEVLNPLMREAWRGLTFSREAAGKASQLLIKAVSARNRGITRVGAILEALEVLAWDRGRNPIASVTYASNPPKIDRRIDDVCGQLVAAYTEEINQAVLAEQTGLTPEAFSRFFKRSTGRTFMEYLHELRIGHACRMLLETDAAISTIAYGSGFGNLANFNRIFRRLKGQSPREYRVGQDTPAGAGVVIPRK